MCAGAGLDPQLKTAAEEPTAAFIPTAQSATGVLIHPATDAIFVAGSGRRIAVLATLHQQRDDGAGAVKHGQVDSESCRTLRHHHDISTVFW